MKLWGPIPRHVLVHTSSHAQSAFVISAAAVALDTLVALARGHAVNNAGLGDELDSPHRLVHERAAGQDAPRGTAAANIEDATFYTRGQIVLASPSWMRFVAERLEKESNWNAKFLIDASVGIGQLGALRGLKFEELVLAMLEEGVEFECRRLLKGGHRGSQSAAGFDAAGAAGGAGIASTVGDDAAHTRIVPAAPRIEWASATELRPHRETASLLVPRSRQEAGLDALIWDPAAGHHWPLDCTVSEQHGVHAQGVSDAVRALGWTPDKGWPDNGGTKGVRHIKYFWVLPEDRFKLWWAAQAAIPGSTTSADASAAFDNLWQYALCVPAAASTTQMARALKAQGVALPQDCVRAEGGERSAVGGAGTGGAK